MFVSYSSKFLKGFLCPFHLPPAPSVKQSGDFRMFDIDHVMSERHEIEERSWSVLNASDVVAAKLIEKNQDAKFLCWKLVLCSQYETVHEDNVQFQNEAALSAADSWLRHKLMPPNSDGDNDLLLSSPDLAIWRSWNSTQSSTDATCCLSVIRSITFEDPNNLITGASAVLFLLSEHIPLEIQKRRLHDLVMLLPSSSRLPLLILSGSSKYESDPSCIAKVLGLHEIDKQRVVTFEITFLEGRDKKHLDGFFSDKHLREGLEWLASESPSQIVVRGTKTRELVMSHLNSTMEILDGMETHGVGPNNCISAFNEALDQSMKQVSSAANANPIGWPCPEIDLLEESSDEYRAATWYLPTIAWSSSSRIDMLISSLNDSKLPALEYDLSWLSRGLNIGDDISDLISLLENCLIGYLTETSKMMGVALAQKEAGIMLQKNTRLELHDTTYYIIPKWPSIFRRIFSWRLMNLNSGEVSSAYILVQHSSSAPSSQGFDNELTEVLLPCVAHPSLDELIEVGRRSSGLWSNHTEHEAFQSRSLPMASDVAVVPTSNSNVILMEHEKKKSEDSVLNNHDRSPIVEQNNDGRLVMRAAKATSNETEKKLSELLEKCNIVQNLIGEKLSLYF